MANISIVPNEKLVQDHNSLLCKKSNVTYFKKYNCPCKQNIQSVEAKMIPVVQPEKRPRSYGGGDSDSGNNNTCPLTLSHHSSFLLINEFIQMFVLVFICK